MDRGAQPVTPAKGWTWVAGLAVASVMAACGAPTVTGAIAGTGGAVGTGGAAGTGGSVATGGGSKRSAPYRVLFDTAHKQAVGNADWIIDAHSPDPSPASPTSETSWTGGISSWGFDLHQSGRYQIKQLPSTAKLAWGGGGPGDLQQVDVFVSDEPELDFAPGEQQALVTFAEAGGGIFLVSDHSGAVRCGSCTEAWRVINAFLETGAGNRYGVKCDGNDVGASGLTGAATSTSLTPHFSAGPFGDGASLIYHSGSTVSLVAGHGSPELIYTSGVGGMMAASELPGGGRLVLMGDSSPADDGTCQCSANLQNGWHEGSDREAILNATAWLAHDGS